MTELTLVAELICEKEWVSKAAFRKVLARTGKIVASRQINPNRNWRKIMPAGVREAARYELNEIVRWALQNQLRQRLAIDGETHAKNAAAALEYFKTIDRFNELGFAFITADLDLRHQLENSIASLLLSGNRNSRSHSKEWWEETFYPETLGLYSALFGEDPVGTFNSDTKSMRGATHVFISEIINEIKLSRHADHLFALLEIDGLDLEEFQFHSDAALRNKIYRWLDEPKDCSSDEKLWRRNRCHYLKAIRE